jgi:hypothetical protein
MAGAVLFSIPFISKIAAIIIIPTNNNTIYIVITGKLRIARFLS